MTTSDSANGVSGDSGPGDDVARRLQSVFRHVFDDPDLIITSDTGPDDVTGWDSLGTVSLLYAVEDEFDVEIDDGEVKMLSTVGAIQRRLTARAPQP